MIVSSSIVKNNKVIKTSYNEVNKCKVTVGNTWKEDKEVTMRGIALEQVEDFCYLHVESHVTWHSKV